MVLSDDITSPSGAVELLRLTLTKLLLNLNPAPTSLLPELTDDPDTKEAQMSILMPNASLIEVYCSNLQIDNQLYNRASFHFPVLLCQDQRGGAEPGSPWSNESNPARSPEALEEFKHSCFLQLRMVMAGDRCTVEEVGFILLCFFPLLICHHTSHNTSYKNKYSGRSQKWMLNLFFWTIFQV